MANRIVKFLFLVILSGCTYTFPEVESPTTGSADFSKVVTVGNSITAGFANGALYDQAQGFSYANILAGQMAVLTPGVFNQPNISSPVGYSGMTPDGIPMGRLILVNPENPLPAPIIPGDAFNSDYNGDKSALNNFGVPGIRLIDADEPGYANKNRYFKRFALDVNSSSLIGDASSANGSFFTFWLGNNDILGYATGGATGNTDGDGTNRDDLISQSLFASKYETIVSQLLSNGASGVLANIPNVTDIPFFTTVPYNFINFDGNNPEDTLAIYNLNLSYSAYNDGLDKAITDNLISTEEANQRKIRFSQGVNAVVIFDEDLTDLSSQGLDKIRKATNSDLLTFFAAIAYGQDNGQGLIGTEAPFADNYVLTPEEQELILTRTAGFNKIINQTVDIRPDRLALVDINRIFAEFAATGVLINGSGLTASIFPPFGGFSLDGIHPNPRGAAFIANNFIEAINKNFGSAIPLVNPNNYPGNELPVLN